MKCDKASQIQFSMTCKVMHRVGTEVLFKDIHIVIGRLTSKMTTAQFSIVLGKLRFTRHLRITVHDTDRGTDLFKLLLARLEELSLESLRFAGDLDGGSYMGLHDLLTSEERGKILRSKLRNLDLPMRPIRENLWPHGYGLLSQDEEDVFDHSAIIRFQPYRQPTKPLTMEISVVGYRDHWRRPPFGTPHNVVRNIIQAIRMKTGCIDELVILGPRQFLPNRLQNPFHSFGLNVPAKPFWLRKLSLVNLRLLSLPSAMYTSFRITTLRSLKVKQCYTSKRLFEHLMSSQDPLLLDTLKIVNHSSAEGLQPDETFGFAAFCKSFSTLKKIEVRVWIDWQTDFDAQILSSHSGLEQCVLSLGKPTLGMATIQTLHTNHKNLKVLGFQCQQIAKSLEQDRFLQEAEKKTRYLAAEIRLFEKLEEWQLIFEPVYSDSTLVSAKTIAREIHRLVVATPLDAYGPSINTISILARRELPSGDRYDKEEVLDMRRFHFLDAVS
jgi:hypothetical protein